MTADRGAAPSPLASPAVRRIMISELVSKLGSRMTLLALPWFVLVSTGSTARMGLVFAVELVPVAVLGVPSGVLVARLGCRRAVVLGDALQAALIALVPLLGRQHVLPFWGLLVVVAALGTVSAPYFAAQRLLIPESLGSDETAVTAGNALVEAAGWAAQFAGPAAAGFLIAWLGALNVLWIDAGTYLLSALVLFGLPRSRPTGAAAEEGRGFLAGARFALHDPTLRRFVIAATGYGLLVPVLLMAIPILADSRYGANPHVAGWLFGVWGAGAVVGTVLVMPLMRWISPARLGACAGVAMAVPLWFLALRQPAITIGAIMGLSGLFVPMLNAPGFALLTTRPPEALRAHVMTFFVTANLLAGPIAYAASGFVFARVGLTPVLVALAVGVTLCSLVLLTMVTGEAGRAPAPAATSGDALVADEG